MVFIVDVHTIALCEVSTLDHELLDDTVEGRSLVAETLLSCCKCTTLGSVTAALGQQEIIIPEIFGRFWHCLSV